MITSDYHMHTTFSDDGKELRKRWRRRHFGKNCKPSVLQIMRITVRRAKKSWFLRIMKNMFIQYRMLRETYKGRLEINLGIEIGLKEDLGPHYQEFIGKYPFDFVIGSLHYINGLDPYYGEIFEAYSDEEVYRMAFRGNDRMCQKDQRF